MRVSAVVGTLAAAASLPAALASVARPRAIQYRNATVVNGVHHVLDSDPALPHADDTTPYCSWWLDNYGSEVCEDVPDWWGISMDDFLRWVSNLESYIATISREKVQEEREKERERRGIC